MKTIISIVATSVLAFFLTACGEKPPVQKVESEPVQVTETQVVPEQTEQTVQTEQTQQTEEQAPVSAPQEESHETTPAEAAGAVSEE